MATTAGVEVNPGSVLQPNEQRRVLHPVLPASREYSTATPYSVRSLKRPGFVSVIFGQRLDKPTGCTANERKSGDYSVRQKNDNHSQLEAPKYTPEFLIRLNTSKFPRTYLLGRRLQERTPVNSLWPFARLGSVFVALFRHHLPTTTSALAAFSNVRTGTWKIFGQGLQYTTICPRNSGAATTTD
ncbi:hypothetical protein CPC735_004720 [Coccidioides posadasii C735 delta SOWgp]|uniref:Uncharacterized protein n=2 Tax=Coccidioides posadasii TaxID=199306 RepID=A0A0J6FJ56_COCPO|nr:hypothetical protein CPC735_004720 [Coccidioides posadasii C735 delta SOWgp]EER26300.1 hypothetical protein CPC735_004720 [Coccidioides posadasii C735 delta SOWgp]KMM73201.1 hypothetical protein CPAG_09490 [Coccidioides posadasii RMSCC 3488]|eukprot:XP_003068445.1 hypothetical protein CPC735_004720 [Coccidioides posadasii C735 delta SOWgp]